MKCDVTSICCVRYGPVLTTLVIGFVFTLNRVIIDRSKCTEDTKVILFYVAALLCAIGEFFMICTALIDSGILVIKSEDEESQSLVGRGTIPYCDTCMLFQINKAAHCSFCDCCVEELDHHCELICAFDVSYSFFVNIYVLCCIGPWMGKCIGKGNMFWFKCFMGTVVIFMIQFAVVGLKYS